MTNVRFEKMQLDDLNEVMQIEIANYPVPWTKGIMKDCINSDYHCVVVKLDWKIIGYAILMTAFDESHLLNMCIDKKQQSQGLGRKLLKHLENICRINHSQVFLLEVRESNPMAQKLYQSFGFEQIGIRKNYYNCIEGREHAIVMTKQLMSG